jgi:uncharacterized protein (DUF342 family)
MSKGGMRLNLFSNSTFNVLERGWDGSQIRQHGISQNVANAGTPNYQAKTVSFKHTLNEAIVNQFQATITNSKYVDFSSNRPGPTVQMNQKLEGGSISAKDSFYPNVFIHFGKYRQKLVSKHQYAKVTLIDSEITISSL